MQIIRITPLIESVPETFSPSRVNFVLKCPLRGLYDHSGNQAYRARGNAGYAKLGNVVHHVFKAASERKKAEEFDFDAAWDTFEAAEGSGDLKASVPNYGKLKFLTRSQVGKFPVTKPKGTSQGSYVQPEHKIVDPVLGLQGQPDLIIFRDFKPYEIKDYKTGKVFDIEPEIEEEETDFEQIKQDYKNQLYLYAFLVKQHYGHFPEFLTIVQPGGREIKTSLTMEPILKLTNELTACKRKLTEQTAKLLANASPENCQYCTFKPGCQWHYREENGILTDIEGKVSQAIVHPYGNFSIHFENGEHFFYKIPAGDMAGDIKALTGKMIYITGVKEEIPAKKVYTPTKISIIYIKEIGTE